MKKIILASNNAHKIRELKEILKDIDVEIKSLREEDINIDVIEDGKTFEENAKKKATEIAAFLRERGDKDFLVMSDDSGLEVDYLKGEPGIYSARYAGEHGNDYENNIKLLKNLSGIKMKDRTARFICQIALVDYEGNYFSVRGQVEGYILEELKEYKDAFGYDPLFYYEPLKKNFSELTGEEKNKISHRGVALEKLKIKLKSII